VGDGFARPWSQLADPHGVQERLAIVDALVGIECHQHVLVDMDGIGARRRDLALAGDDRPRSRTQEGLARHLGENRLQARIGRACIDGHQPRIGFSGILDLAHGGRR